MAYCPSCKWYHADCNPDVEDYDKACSSYELYEEEDYKPEIEQLPESICDDGTIAI